MKIFWLLCLLPAALLLAAAPSSAQKDKDADANKEKEAKKVELAKTVLGQAKVDFAKAMATAQAKVPDGKLLVGRVELKEAARYGFYFLDGEKVQEVEVDVKSGEVVKFKEKKEPAKNKKFADAMKIAKDAKVTFAEAMKIGAKKVADGKLFEIEWELKDDKAIVELEYLVKDKITRVQIAAKDATSITVK